MAVSYSITLLNITILFDATNKNGINKNEIYSIKILEENEKKIVYHLHLHCMLSHACSSISKHKYAHTRQHRYP